MLTFFHVSILQRQWLHFGSLDPHVLEKLYKVRNKMFRVGPTASISQEIKNNIPSAKRNDLLSEPFARYAHGGYSPSLCLSDIIKHCL